MHFSDTHGEYLENFTRPTKKIDQVKSLCILFAHESLFMWISVGNRSDLLSGHLSVFTHLGGIVEDFAFNVLFDIELGQRVGRVVRKEGAHVFSFLLGISC